MRNYFCSANLRRKTNFRRGGFYIRPTNSPNFDADTYIVGDGYPSRTARRYNTKYQ